MVLDHCHNMTSDPTARSVQCKTSLQITGPREQLNVAQPLSLGGVARGGTMIANGFNGCIRNLFVNGEVKLNFLYFKNYTKFKITFCKL